MPHESSHESTEPGRTNAPALHPWLERLALGGTFMLLVAMIAGLLVWQGWLDRRDEANHAWWVAHSEPLHTQETVQRVVVGQMTTYKGRPFDAWARAETPDLVVIRSLRAVGCGAGDLAFGDWVDHEDLDPIQALDGQSLAGVDARVLRALPGEAADPPCPTLVVDHGYWTFDGKRIAVLSRRLHDLRIDP